MIIELKKYNEVGELLIGTAATGLHGHICYQDGVLRVYVTMVAVHIGVMGMGMLTGGQDAYNWSVESLMMVL